MLLHIELYIDQQNNVISEKYQIFNCWTPECGYCSNMDCTVSVTQDLLYSEEGIVVVAELKYKKSNTIVFFDDCGREIGQLQWSLRAIILTGCIACRAPGALMKLRNKCKYQNGRTAIAISLDGGVLRFKIKGMEVFKNELRGECKEVYSKVKKIAFSNMSSKNSYCFVASKMEAGIRLTSDCAGNR